MLTACTADLPKSVVEGSTVRVGWSQSLTSLNVASAEGDTPGNLEIASVTHDGFARVAGGEVVLDEDFGTVEVLDPSPGSFTVRYDLADRTWSDGIPIDSADLLLAWAAGSGATGGEFGAVPGALSLASDLPEVDDFGRRIDVTFSRPVRTWQTALDVAVPAHVVGQRALGIKDPMEAKQAVIDAILGNDESALAEIAEVWSTGFDLDGAGDVPDDLRVGSGPYLVTAIEGTEPTTTVSLEVNRAYDGEVPASYERIEVVSGADPLAGFPGDLDVVQVDPKTASFSTVRGLVRRDHHVAYTHAGQVWTLALRTKGVFASVEARRAFLRATTPADVRSAGAGDWDDAYSSTQSLLFSPESDGYEIAIEDAGYRAAFEADVTDTSLERAQAGVPAGTEVCVRYDSDDPFAVGAVRGLAQSVAEAGWVVTDCGEPDIAATSKGRASWQAVLVATPLPERPTDITDVWGGKRRSPLTGERSRERERLVEQLDQTVDVYDARDLQVAIEAQLIEEAVALPLALDPVVTLSTRDMNAVLPDSGASATLLGDAATWEPAK